jgi:serine/threonine-protein kinase
MVSVAVVAGAVAILATGSVKLLSRKDLRTAAPAVAASAPAIVEPAGASEPDGSRVPRTEPTPAASVAGPDVRTEPEPIVRPKGSASGGRVAAADRAKPPSALVRRERSPVRTSSADFADRATVGSPRATLPRGTLVAVKLLRALAGPNPGRAEAIVTEEVAADGVVLVPKGSTVSCSARPPADGRVPLSCDSISTSDRVLTFSGVAVGEGQHVGLRLLDDEIAAGTPFVVYVSAPAALR